MNSTIIRNFRHEDMPLLSEFYQKVAKDKNVVFWWVGPEQNWENVFCAFENDLMVAKGQVEVIHVVQDGQPIKNSHKIFINIKTISDRETDYELLDRLFEKVYQRALKFKEMLSANYKTKLCVGNFSTETNNNLYFSHKGFQPLNTLYTMNRDLTKPITEIALHHLELQWEFWQMDSLEDEKEYLKEEGEIWPDATLGNYRLQEYKSNPNWTAIPVRYYGELIACAMAWQEAGIGVIEDVFVKDQWRNQGIAKFLLTTGLKYLKDLGLFEAKLMVDTENEKALNLYQSVGFEVTEEEKRFYIELI